jgi:predicted amino acid racemase
LPWRIGQNHHVRERDRLLVALEPDEAPVFGHIHPVPVLVLQTVQRAREPVFKRIGHGHQLHRSQGMGVERVIGGTGAATAAADERDLQFIAAGRVGHAFQREIGQRRAGDNGGG